MKSPASTATYTVTVNEASTVITVTATAGNPFDAQGRTVLTFTAEDSGAPCVVGPPAAPVSTDPCR